MFFQFTSDVHLDREHWRLVWDMEVWVFSPLMEADRLLGLSEEQLMTRILSHVEERLPTETYEASNKIARHFLRQDIPHIRKFLHENEKTIQPLVIKPEVIGTCLEQSRAFGEHCMKTREGGGQPPAVG